jgi:hypothetical protein
MFRRLMQWGMSMVVIAPFVAWAVFILPCLEVRCRDQKRLRQRCEG